MGWLVLLVMVFLIGAILLRWGQLDSRSWTIIGAALALGAFGYALEGRPELESSTVSQPETNRKLDPMISSLIQRAQAEPSNGEIWAVLGEALLEKSQGQPTPAALFCLQRAQALGMKLPPMPSQ